jgi:hypothetical protein
VATQYILLTTEAAARAESEAEWNAILGRARLPQDITRYLSRIVVDPVDGRALVVMDDQSYGMITPKLSNQEQRALDNKLLPANAPDVVQILTRAELNA